MCAGGCSQAAAGGHACARSADDDLPLAHDVDTPAEAVEGAPSLAIYANPVVAAGRVELLTFLREQAVSVTAHRFGTPHRYEIPLLEPVR